MWRFISISKKCCQKAAFFYVLYPPGGLPFGTPEDYNNQEGAPVWLQPNRGDANPHHKTKVALILYTDLSKKERKK